MFPFALPGEEEQFAREQKEAQRHDYTDRCRWEVFASSFPHEAFLLQRLMSIYENMAVVLRILHEKQKEDEPVPAHNRFSCPSHPRSVDYLPPLSKLESLERPCWYWDPLEYFLNEDVDFACRKVFLELFASLETEMQGSKKWAMWREIGRMILENSYDAERASLVEELTSAASAEAFSTITGPSTHATRIRLARHQMGEGGSHAESPGEVEGVAGKGREKGDTTFGQDEGTFGSNEFERGDRFNRSLHS